MCHMLVILGCGVEGYVALAGFEVGVTDGVAVGVVDGGVGAVADGGQGDAVVGASDADAVRADADGAGVEDGPGVDGGVGLDGQVAGAAEGGGFEPGLVWGGPAGQGAVAAVLVVVGAVGVEQVLECPQAGGCWLGGQPFFEGLVVTLDLP